MSGVRCWGSRGKTGTLRIKAHNFDIINVKKKLELGFIRINSLVNNYIKAICNFKNFYQIPTLRSMIMTILKES